MTHKAWIAGIFLIFSAIVNAEDNPTNVQQGAEGYDWATCITTKAAQCKNACATSSDIHCKDTCNDLASDKCQSQGLRPPQ